MEFHQLVRTWLVCASCQMPVISKSFELQIQVGGGKGSNKVRNLCYLSIAENSNILNTLTSHTVRGKSSLNYTNWRLPDFFLSNQVQDERSESCYSIQPSTRRFHGVWTQKSNATDGFLYLQVCKRVETKNVQEVSKKTIYKEQLQTKLRADKLGEKQLLNSLYICGIHNF